MKISNVTLFGALALGSGCMPPNTYECGDSKSAYVELAAQAPGISDLSEYPFVCSDEDVDAVARADLKRGFVIFQPTFFGEAFERYVRNDFHTPYTYFHNVHRADVCRVAYDGLMNPQGSPWGYDDTILRSAVTIDHELSHLEWDLPHSESYVQVKDQLDACEDAGKPCTKEEKAFEAELAIDPFARADEALYRRMIEDGLPTIDMANRVSQEHFEACFFPQLTDVQAKWARGELSDERYDSALGVLRAECAELAMGICDSTEIWY